MTFYRGQWEKNLSMAWRCSVCHAPFTPRHQSIHPVAPYATEPPEIKIVADDTVPLGMMKFIHPDGRVEIVHCNFP